MAVNSKNVVHFVEFGANKIATIDSKTMAIKEYTCPIPRRARAVSRSRRTTSSGTRISRAVSSAASIRRPARCSEWPSPSGPKSEPYGIIFTKGALWYNESFAKPNTIVRFDPKTEKFQTWAIPGGGDIVRNMDVTPDGNPVTANSLVNQVGLVEIK